MLDLRPFVEGDVYVSHLIDGAYFARPDGEPTLTVVCNDEPVGLVWFSEFDGVNAYVTLGMATPGNGYGKEIADSIARFAFQEMKVHRLATTVVLGNDAAMAISEKWGVIEGQFREAFQDAAGAYHDVVVFSLLESEWKG